jgi:hypothetical protein
MKIFILAEQRSGSTNLSRWFRTKEDFTVLIEPFNPHSTDFKNNINLKYITKNLLIKETFNGTNQNLKLLKELINVYDKTIVLYRKDKTQQLESWTQALRTHNWVNRWFENKFITPTKENSEYFNEMGIKFKSNFLDNNELFSISYEELYESENGINKLIDFINLDTLTSDGFPYGERYRTIKVIDKLI